MKNKLFFALCAVLMVLLGTSDALRGVFSPLFLSSFGFSEAMVGVIVSASYLGNLVFLLIGGNILDRLGIRKSMFFFIIMMALSLCLLLFGYEYSILIAGFFLTLGLSTLLNTSINIASDNFSDNNSLSYLNILFFIQGIGTSGSQLLLSPYADSKKAWNITLIVLASLMIPILMMLSRTNLDEKKGKAQINEKTEGKISYIPLLILILSLSFYTIAEHGVTNYIISYGIALGRDSAEMGRYLALYSIGIMSGRLILGFLISRTGDLGLLPDNCRILKALRPILIRLQGNYNRRKPCQHIRHHLQLLIRIRNREHGILLCDEDPPDHNLPIPFVLASIACRKKEMKKTRHRTWSKKKQMGIYEKSNHTFLSSSPSLGDESITFSCTLSSFLSTHSLFSSFLLLEK